MKPSNEPTPTPFITQYPLSHFCNQQGSPSSLHATLSLLSSRHSIPTNLSHKLPHYPSITNSSLPVLLSFTMLSYTPFVIFPISSLSICSNHPLTHILFCPTPSSIKFSHKHFSYSTQADPFHIPITISMYHPPLILKYGMITFPNGIP